MTPQALSIPYQKCPICGKRLMFTGQKRTPVPTKSLLFDVWKCEDPKCRHLRHYTPSLDV